MIFFNKNRKLIEIYNLFLNKKQKIRFFVKNRKI